MSTRVIIGIASFCAVMTGLILANMFLFMMIGEINRKRAEGNLVSYFGFAFPKMQRIFSEYRIKYPNSTSAPSLRLFVRWSDCSVWRVHWFLWLSVGDYRPK